MTDADKAQSDDEMLLQKLNTALTDLAKIKNFVTKMNKQVNNLKSELSDINKRIVTLSQDIHSVNNTIIELKTTIPQIIDKQKDLSTVVIDKITHSSSLIKTDLNKKIEQEINKLSVENKNSVSNILKNILALPRLNANRAIFFDINKQKAVAPTNLKIGRTYFIYLRKKQINDYSEKATIHGKIKGNITDIVHPPHIVFEEIKEQKSSLLRATIEIREPTGRLKKLLIPLHKSGYIELYVDNLLDDIIPIGTKSFWHLIIFAGASLSGVIYSIYSGIVNVITTSITVLNGLILIALIILILSEIKK